MNSSLIAPISVLLSASLLSACSPISTSFSCNATASDRCLSIEEVNAMTESHAERQVAPARLSPRRFAPMKAENSMKNDTRFAQKTQTIWVAPWVDAHGVRHQDDTLFAQIQSTHQSA